MVNGTNGAVAGELAVEGLLIHRRIDGRPKFDPDKRRQVVRVLAQSGASLNEVAIANGISQGLLRKWVLDERVLASPMGGAVAPKRGTVRRGRANSPNNPARPLTLLPVVVKPAPAADLAVGTTIEVALLKGSIRLQSIDTATLRTLVELLA